MYKRTGARSAKVQLPWDHPGMNRVSPLDLGIVMEGEGGLLRSNKPKGVCDSKSHYDRETEGSSDRGTGLILSRPKKIRWWLLLAQEHWAFPGPGSASEGTITSPPHRQSPPPRMYKDRA